MKLVVIKESCPQNHHCPSVKVCPVGALKQEENKAPTVDESLCTKCGKCARYCPKGALQIEK